MKRSIIAFFSVLALSTNASANTGMKQDQPGKMGTEKSGQKSEMMTSDKMKQSMALNEIHHLNQREIDMAKMVQKKAQSTELKQYAQTILQDHQQADKRIQELAKSQNIELSKYSPAGHEKQLKSNLEKMSGTEFDRAFIEMAKMDHKQSMQEIKQLSSTELRNPQIQQYVDSEFMPTLEKHERTVSTLTVGGQAGESGEMTETSESDSSEMGGQMGSDHTSGSSSQ